MQNMLEPHPYNFVQRVLKKETSHSGLVSPILTNIQLLYIWSVQYIPTWPVFNTTYMKMQVIVRTNCLIRPYRQKWNLKYSPSSNQHLLLNCYPSLKLHFNDTQPTNSSLEPSSHGKPFRLTWNIICHHTQIGPEYHTPLQSKLPLHGIVAQETKFDRIQQIMHSTHFQIFTKRQNWLLKISRITEQMAKQPK